MILNSETNHDSGGGGSLPTTAIVSIDSNCSFDMDVYATFVSHGSVVSDRVTIIRNGSTDFELVVPSYISFFSSDGIYGFYVSSDPISAADQTGYTDNADGAALYVTGECGMTIKPS